ncbi:unnamed protein product [Ectocarpus sp. CCAP 1310/34]|nr:unnamed protein product [Ectocarpus sp. CCAP 1310/34]
MPYLLVLAARNSAGAARNVDKWLGSKSSRG